MAKNHIAVIGAGVIGCSIAYVLARNGHEVTLIDRAEPGIGGASFGNAGHIATELVEPLPSFALMAGFWRMLTVFDGPLSFSPRQVPAFLPWAVRFAAAAFARRRNTEALAPIVRDSRTAWSTLLREIRRPELLCGNGHYHFWLGPKGETQAATEAAHMARLQIETRPAPFDLLRSVAAAAGAPSATGLHFPESGHLVDPKAACAALAELAVHHGARFQRAAIQSLEREGAGIALIMDGERMAVSNAIVCTGVWSAPLLEKFGMRVPLQSVRGYHIEKAGQPLHVDAPSVYVDHNIIVTPMTGRMRASGFMEFEAADAPPDPAKTEYLKKTLHRLGYSHDVTATWHGARPVLPDYLPAIGRAPGLPELFYALGHQHVGLTLAPITAEIADDLVADRTPKYDPAPFDLRRFG